MATACPDRVIEHSSSEFYVQFNLGAVFLSERHFMDRGWLPAAEIIRIAPA